MPRLCLSSHNHPWFRQSKPYIQLYENNLDRHSAEAHLLAADASLSLLPQLHSVVFWVFVSEVSLCPSCCKSPLH